MQRRVGIVQGSDISSRSESSSGCSAKQPLLSASITVHPSITTPSNTVSSSPHRAIRHLPCDPERKHLVLSSDATIERVRQMHSQIHCTSLLGHESCHWHSAGSPNKALKSDPGKLSSNLPAQICRQLTRAA